MNHFWQGFEKHAVSAKFLDKLIQSAHSKRFARMSNEVQGKLSKLKRNQSPSKALKGMPIHDKYWKFRGQVDERARKSLAPGDLSGSHQSMSSSGKEHIHWMARELRGLKK